ncbi:MAG TPA: hypothetical protein VIV60_01240 [Polyangiaceae bacterium]
MRNHWFKSLGLLVAVAPFGCMAIHGGIVEGDSAGGSTGQAGVAAAGSSGADLHAGFGVTHESPYPCSASTFAVYDEPPVSPPEQGCVDIYSTTRFYPVGATRTIVAPTAPQGASCVAVDCWCSADLRWAPANGVLCGQ